MALTDESVGTTMLVQPTGGMPYGNNGNGFGFGGDWAWILLLLVLGGGWGGFGMGGYGGMGMDGFGLYPWLNNSQNINDGFRDQMLNSNVAGIQNSITSGFGDVQTALCGGFAGVNQGVSNSTAAIQNSLCNGFNGVTNAINGSQNALAQQLYTNQIADLERSYAAQTANTQGMTAMQSQLAQCCCDNRLATAQTQALVQSENCADRQVFSDGLRDVMANSTANTQRLVDSTNAAVQGVMNKLNQLELNAKDDRIAELQNELNFARLAANNDTQTGTIQLGQRNLANEIEQYVAPRPIPSYAVQNPNCCANTTGCGGF